MQRNIFEESDVKASPVSPSLLIKTNYKKVLSKQQLAFNKLVKKIEKLRLEIQQTGNLLDQKLDLYFKDLQPLEKVSTELIKEIVRLQYAFFENKKLLSKNERHHLGGVIARQLDIIFQLEKDKPCQEMKDIFEAVQGISFEQSLENDFNSVKSEIESMFEDIDMNFDDIHSKMTNEEIVQKTLELQEKLEQRAREEANKQATRKKTKKQLEMEEKVRQKEEARTKNISNIYKQLAKIFHPDLEPNEELKLQKEELMKQLTNAYENNDLHTLLHLELNWIQKEENNLEKLTEDKLQIYNEVLKEQSMELEVEIDNIFRHERYHPLQRYVDDVAQMKYINIKAEKKQLEIVNNEIVADIKTLKGNLKPALLLLRKLIHDFMLEKKFMMDIQRFM